MSEKFVGVADGLYYEVYGPPTRPPCLTLTGWGTGTGHKVAAIPEIVRSTFRLIAYDHPGMGRSTARFEKGTTSVDLARATVAILDDLGIDQCVMFGRGGYGGCLALQLAVSHPERVRAVVAIQAWARADAFLRNQISYLWALRQSGFTEYQRAAAGLCYRPEYFTAHEGEIISDSGPWSDIRDCMEAQGRLMAASASHDLKDSLGAISAPTLLVTTGAHEWITGTRLGEELSSLMSDASIIRLPEAPHALHTLPEEWARLDEQLANWFQREGLDRLP